MGQSQSTHALETTVETFSHLSMGNAGCTLHHPPFLEAEPYLDAGHMVDPPGIGILRFQKNADAAFGVGGRVVFKNTETNDDSKYSELYFYVEYNDSDKDGQLRWNRNDLNLEFQESWGENSELTIHIFKQM